MDFNLNLRVDTGKENNLIFMINLKKESPEVYYTNQKRILLNKKALNSSIRKTHNSGFASIKEIASITIDIVISENLWGLLFLFDSTPAAAIIIAAAGVAGSQ